MKHATRLNSFVSETGDVAAALREIAATGSIKYVDLNYPEHFVGRSVADMRQLLDELGLTINSVAKNTTPLSMERIESQAAVIGVLELNAGFAERWGAEAGTRVFLELGH